MACRLHRPHGMSKVSSLATFMLSLLGVGAAIATLGLVVGRRDAAGARGAPAKLEPRLKVALAGAAASSCTSPRMMPRRSASPMALWDITALAGEGDVRRPATSTLYGGVERDDSSGARWLARATQAAGGEEFDEVDADDPAEIAADSVSMISQASRAAAAREPSDDDELSES